VNNAGFTHLSRFGGYGQKRFDLPLLAGCFADRRPQPGIPSRAIVNHKLKRVGREWKTEPKEQNWIWVVAGDLDGDDGAAIREMGHLRWKTENHAFGELTQHWHPTHCAHHPPLAVVALPRIKIIAFTLFHAFAIWQGKLFRLGKTTLQELRKQIYRSWLCGSPMPFFSG
jgi:hypothetical protein